MDDEIDRVRRCWQEMRPFLATEDEDNPVRLFYQRISDGHTASTSAPRRASR